jgi:hypothetical protein
MKRIRVFVCLSEEEKERWRSFAYSADLSISDFIRSTINKHVTQNTSPDEIIIPATPTTVRTQPDDESELPPVRTPRNDLRVTKRKGRFGDERCTCCKRKGATPCFH